MRNWSRFAFAALASIWFLSSCAPDANPLAGTQGSSGVAGFWMGLWHGLICVVTFVVSLFNPSVQIYEVHNNGAWYNFGFLLGASASLGGAGRGSARSSRR